MIAKLICDDEGQVLVFPEGFHIDAEEVYFERQGDVIILRPVTSGS